MAVHRPRREASGGSRPADAWRVLYSGLGLAEQSGDSQPQEDQREALACGGARRPLLSESLHALLQSRFTFNTIVVFPPKLNSYKPAKARRKSWGTGC